MVCLQNRSDNILELRDWDSLHSKAITKVNNPNSMSFCVIKSDGCIPALGAFRQKKCDFLVICGTEHYFIENKGYDDIIKAKNQILNTESFVSAVYKKAGCVGGFGKTPVIAHTPGVHVDLGTRINVCILEFFAKGWRAPIIKHKVAELFL